MTLPRALFITCDGTAVILPDCTCASSPLECCVHRPSEPQARAVSAEAREAAELIHDLWPEMGTFFRDNTLEPAFQRAIDFARAKALRIFTRCPACGNDTLIINDGHLLCTWHECKDPCAIENGHKDRAFAETIARLESELSSGGHSVRMSAATVAEMTSLRADKQRLESELAKVRQSWSFEANGLAERLAAVTKELSEIRRYIAESELTEDGAV